VRGENANPVPQEVQIVPTESGTFGTADFGTRLKAVFSNIPEHVTISVPLQLTDAITGTIATLVNSESGELSPSASGELTANNGTAAAVWEVTSLGETSTSPQIDRLSGEVSVSFTHHPGSPALGTAKVAGSFAPTSTEMLASATAPIPRFAGAPIVKDFRH
jgi:hypothetical protein